MIELIPWLISFIRRKLNLAEFYPELVTWSKLTIKEDFDCGSNLDARNYCDITKTFSGSSLQQKDNNQCSTPQIKPLWQSVQNKHTPKKKALASDKDPAVW